MVGTGYWVGHPGALLPLPDLAGTLGRAGDRSATFASSAGGHRRVYLSARRAPLREWKVTIPAVRPDEAAVFHSLLAATDPPYMWVDPWARLTNLQSPADATMQTAVPTLAPLGRQPLEGGGWAAVAGSNPSLGVVNIPPVPVVSSQPVTVSAYLGAAGAALVSAVFFNSAGVAIGAPVPSPTVTGLALLRRASVSIPLPPTNAVAVSIRITNASVIANPAVTWSDALLEYGSGGGAAQVVITGIDEGIVMARSGVNGQRYSELSFTVTEVS